MANAFATAANYGRASHHVAAPGGYSRGRTHAVYARVGMQHNVFCFLGNPYGVLEVSTFQQRGNPSRKIGCLEQLLEVFIEKYDARAIRRGVFRRSNHA